MLADSLFYQIVINISSSQTYPAVIFPMLHLILIIFYPKHACIECFSFTDKVNSLETINKVYEQYNNIVLTNFAYKNEFLEAVIFYIH